MFAYIGHRHDMMAHIPAAPVATVVEVGVCKGENAEWMLAHFQPDTLHLVDEWKVFAPSDPPFYFADGPEGKRALENYFGGPVDAQETFDTLCETTTAKFTGNDTVKVLRASSREAVDRFDDGSVDVLYIDANHGYTAVLDDLFIWERKLSATGYLVLNDHTINASGTAEYGVVQATTTFLRNRTQFQPIAMNLARYADLIIGRRGVDHSGLLRNLIASGKAVEIPDAMISNFHLRQSGGLSWLSFA